MNIRKAAAWVSTMILAIMVTGFATSYVTLAEFLHRYQVETWASWTIPFTIDLLAISATVSRHVLPKGQRAYATWVALTGVAVSVTANVAGSPNWVARAGHAWPIIAYLLGEGLVMKLLSYAASVEGKTVQQQPATAMQLAETELVADEAVSPDLPAAPVSPAPAGTAAPAPAARKGRPRHQVKLDADGAVVRKETGERVPRTTARRIVSEQPERLMTD